MRAFSVVVHCAAWLFPYLGTTFAALPFGRANYTTSVSTVFQLEQNGTWFENLHVRRNGNVIVSRFDVPEIWSITPGPDGFSQGYGSLLYRFPNATSVLGIAEMERDVYAVIAGNISLPSIVPTPGSFVVWMFDLKEQEPRAKVLAPMPAGEFLDGVARFRDDLLLITDAGKGVIWRLNTTSGEYSVALSHSTMLPAEGQPVKVGVNGLKVFRNYIYYTSTSQEVYARIPVDQNASATGPVEVIMSGLTFDDLVLTASGTAYMTTNPQNELVEISPEGRVHLVAGNQFEITLGGLTSVAFSRDYSILYVTTCGAQFTPVMGKVMEPAKLVAVKLRVKSGDN
ncbi:hypothetical protein ETB97_008946 [Aspergillus alliaceus]|uniref:Uncharacterized protein n=1 Tax=Petromyces alliaceus TaxID=209559 RepID=A0A8H6ABJ0_PETAA|nr:hypothetical protein ETB97_008946 [Aspergillus burnettii]